MSELEDLRRQVAELKSQIDPPPRPRSTHQPYDPTENFSLPASVVREMCKAVPDSLMRDLRADARKPNAVTGGAAPPAQPVKRGTGWIDERPIEPPPGVALADRLVDQQDQIDKAELVVRLAKAAAVERAGKKE